MNYNGIQRPIILEIALKNGCDEMPFTVYYKHGVFAGNITMDRVIAVAGTNRQDLIVSWVTNHS